ncbi:MAG: hypothetical protein VCD33_10325 [Alphaproteobacteria bacterium]|jgi:hypothetical protein
MFVVPACLKSARSIGFPGVPASLVNSVIPALIMMGAGKRDRASPTVWRQPAWRLNAFSKITRVAPERVFKNRLRAA